MESRVKYSRTASRKQYRRSMENFAIVALAVALLLRIFVLSTTYVDGFSMVPTLFHGERVVVFKVAYTFTAPKRFDVVVCEFPEENQPFVKRVIGLPGETVELRGREGIYIDGVQLEGDEYGIGTNPRTGTWQVPAGSYFLMGDNREHSKDSASLGPLEKGNITGKASLIYWPLKELKFI